MAPQKGKLGTKGQKQIVEDNKQTIKFYTYMGGGASAIYFITSYFFFWENFGLQSMFMPVVAAAVYIGSVQFLTHMAKASYSETGQLLDGGLDLNMESGVAEHVKDLTILTAICQVLSLISNYFWMLWLLAPARAAYMLWVNILGPWFFQSAPEVSEKKQKKMERKMKRH